MPTFLLDLANRDLALFMYLLILVVAITSSVAIWYSHSEKNGNSMIVHGTYDFYNFAMSSNSHSRMLPGFLAG